MATYALGLYVAHFATFDATYGALAGVIVLMLWFYLTAFVLVCAAELAALLVRLSSPQLPAGPDQAATAALGIEPEKRRPGRGDGPGPGRTGSDAV